MIQRHHLRVAHDRADGRVVVTAARLRGGVGHERARRSAVLGKAGQAQAWAAADFGEGLLDAGGNLAAFFLPRIWQQHFVFAGCVSCQEVSRPHRRGYQIHASVFVRGRAQADAQQSQGGLCVRLGAGAFLDQAIVEVAVTAHAGFRGTYVLLLEHQGDAADDHGLSDCQGDALPGRNARGAHVRAIGAAQILDLDPGANVKQGMLTRCARVGNPNVSVIVTTQRQRAPLGQRDGLVNIGATDQNVQHVAALWEAWDRAGRCSHGALLRNVLPGPRHRHSTWPIPATPGNYSGFRSGWCRRWSRP